MNKRIFNILGILGLFVAGSIGGQLGIEVARAAFWQWSQTAINNQTADPSINWSEGQSPSSVNDSARAMMARLVEQANDTSGALNTAGGPVAFTVTTNQGYPNPPKDGQIIGVTFNVANGTNPTLAVDGGTAYPIVSAPGTYAAPDTVIPGMPYTLRYNAASGWWMLRDSQRGGYGGVPLGTILPYSVTGNPVDANYVVAAGECISTTTYAQYWALMGSPAPGGCPAGQFAVLDLRGRVLAGTDVMGGSGSAGRLTANGYGCGAATTAVGSVCATPEYHYMTANELVAHNHSAPIYDPGHWHQLPYADPGHYHATSTADPSHRHSAATYDPSHAHGASSNQAGASNASTTGGGGFATGYAQAQTITVNASGTGNRVWDGGTLDVTYYSGTGVYMNSGNGANTVGSSGTGITFTGSGGNWSDYTKATGVRVNGAALDYTATVGGSYPFSVVQPTIVVNYIIRVL